MIAKTLMQEVPIITPDTTGIVAMSLLDELKLLHLPVVSDNVYVGLISESMVYSMENPEQSLSEAGVRPENIFAPENQHLFEIVRIFIEHQLSMLPVVDTHKNYLGSIFASDVVRSFGDFASVREPGGVIVLEMGIRDYSLQQIAGIVESNDAKILSAHASTRPDSTKMEVVIKVNKLDIRPILQTFSRYNYTVSASFQEEEHEESLKDRYDALMDYLKF